MYPSTRCTALDSNTFVLGLNNLHATDNEQDEAEVLPTRFHFVLDNSGSMGHLTTDARNCFSELVSRATAPCTLVCFTAVAHTIGRNFTTPEMMRASRLPAQGQTNITAGISMAIDIILDIESKHGSGKTHHILVLLSDGEHNKGPYPGAEAPLLGKKVELASPNCQLSVIVVGVSRNSNTNMGMVMKTNLETLPLPSLLPIYFAVTPSDMKVALEQMREGIESVKGTSVNIEVLFMNEKELQDHEEEEKQFHSSPSFWSNVSSSVKSLLNAADDNQEEEGGGTSCGILTNVGIPLSKSIDVWVNDNEEIPLICVGSCPPLALIVKYSNGKINEIPISNIIGGIPTSTSTSMNYQTTIKKIKHSSNKNENKKKSEWTCQACTFINKSEITLACDVCGTTRVDNNKKDGILMNEDGEEVKHQDEAYSNPLTIETATEVTNCFLTEDGDNVASSFLNAGTALSQLQEEEAIPEKKKNKMMVEDDKEYEAFDEELATLALESLLEKARIQKIANTSQKTLNKNMIKELKLLISSFEKQMEIKKLKQEKFRLLNGGDGNGFKFEKLNGYERVKQHKMTARALNGLKELQNQLAAIEAFESTDSSSQAEFLNGSKSKYAAKALSRNAKRFGGENGGIDPMTALVNEFGTTMQDKMKMALRADMCKRVALATRETDFKVIESYLKKEQTSSSSASTNISSSSSSLSAAAVPSLSSSSQSVFTKIVPNIVNRTKLFDIFMKVGKKQKKSFTKLMAKKIVGNLIMDGITVQKIDEILLNVENVINQNKQEGVFEELDIKEIDINEVTKELIQILDKTNVLDDCVDEYLVSTSSVDIGNGNKDRSSYLSLLTQREQLGEWAESSQECGSICTGGAYEALMFLGTLAYPIDVSRRAATQLDPYAMKINRVRTSIIDTSSLCCALQSNHELVPPEGGLKLSDALVLIDCDCPQSSKLANKSILLGEIYTSVVLSRDLNMYTGISQRIALHANAFSTLSFVQSNNLNKMKKQKRKDIISSLQRTFLNKAYQCSKCSFGPIDHYACGDLQYHHLESVENNIQINNSCPKCGWFSENIEDWTKWNGNVPEEMFEEKNAGKNNKKKMKKKNKKQKDLEKEINLDENIYNGNYEVPSRSNIEVLLRVLYSSRILMGKKTCLELVSKLSNWEESITPADGIDHPLQLMLALACICDEDIAELALTSTPALLLVLNEMCSRNARDILKMKANNTSSTSSTTTSSTVTDGSGGGDESDNLVTFSRKFVSQFLGIHASSAPEAKGLEEAEPSFASVREQCCADYTIKSSSSKTTNSCYDDDKENLFDFETFIMNSTENILSVILVTISLRKILLKRKGGWDRLAQDMETGYQCYVDVIDYLSSSQGLMSCGTHALFDAILNLNVNNNDNNKDKDMKNEIKLENRILYASQKQQKDQEENDDDDDMNMSHSFKGKLRILATMTAQAFLHYNSNKRRSIENGGSLSEPLGDVRDGETLRNLCIDLRMYIYQDRVHSKMKQWKSVGSDIVVAKARASDLGQYIALFGSLHAHGLDKPTFWGLWQAALMDKSENGEKVQYFLSKANNAFALKHKK